jgi:hypothetical protein
MDSIFVTDQRIAEETWVTTSEAAQITGYNRQYVIRLAWKMAQQPQAEREIKIRRRNGHELWLPDLITYLNSPRRGPQPKRTKKE